VVVAVLVHTVKALLMVVQAQTNIRVIQGMERLGEATVRTLRKIHLVVHMAAGLGSPDSKHQLREQVALELCGPVVIDNSQAQEPLTSNLLKNNYG
jgi:hypothetical protein